MKSTPKKPDKCVESKQPCPDEDGCGSSDAFHLYERENGDQYGYCYACEQHFAEPVDVRVVNKPTGASRQSVGRAVGVVHSLEDVLALTSVAIPDRKISKHTTLLYGVRESEDTRFYPVCKNGELQTYKARVLPKENFYLLEAGHSSCDLFGQWLWPQHQGRQRKLLIITIGEEDAMAAYQMTKAASRDGKGWACVSLPLGCGVKKGGRAVQNNVLWIETFEKVIFAVDQEEDKDLKDAKEYCKLLTPGKGYIARFSEKDASDMLKANKSSEFLESLEKARKYTPDGIVGMEQAREMWKERDRFKALPWPPHWGLDEISEGLRPCQLTIFTAGVSVGKTTLFKQLEYYVWKHTDCGVGILHLEEDLVDTVAGLMGLHTKTRVDMEEDALTDEEQDMVFEELKQGDRIQMEVQFGSMNELSILDKLRYMIVAHNCRYLFIDHLTVMAMGGKDKADEALMNLVIALKSLAMEKKVWIGAISHVRKTQSEGSKGDAKTYETGKVPSLDSMWGTMALKGYADVVVAMERNVRVKPSITRLHVIKNRRTKNGDTTTGNPLMFNYDTGWYEKCTRPVEEDEDE